MAPIDRDAMYKVAYDQAAASLTSQQASLGVLHGRAKDIPSHITVLQ